MAFNDYRDIIRQMEREMQQLSDEAFRGFFAIPAGGAGRFWQPPIDIHETDEAILVKVELAGVKADDLQVSLTPDDRILNISGSRSESSRDREGRTRCHQMEIYFGPFERAVALPSGIRLDRDAIKATYREGFLLVALPKKRSAEQAGPQIIPISTEETTQENEDNK
ncbi:MAG: Hsp20/alpha crystallin family protein [Janthinobacterium lividum]